jgi:signal transduction histidine kinase
LEHVFTREPGAAWRRGRRGGGARDGTGLGLSIAQSVVTAHRATVTARSQPAGGLDIAVVIARATAR